MSSVLEGLFVGEAPDREWVLAEAFPFQLEDRKTRLSDPRMWPPELDDRPEDGKYRTIDRRGVFAIAGRPIATPEDELSAAQLMVSVTIWGTGLRGRNAVASV
ncbi:hypothetical protein H8Z51_20675 [Mycobacterium avium subsp. hominissuis]|uniref:8-oxoguanine DNA glycosylase OGG fold protein n=1 Tax=Mycobacterium avium TaxID=1764 RepID=UPI001CE08F81|nr:hypothetical protein [Mycobacterium avium]MCA4761177.1 hypothetical protein [Mycobacterium avium subsp. hominissuis]